MPPITNALPDIDRTLAFFRTENSNPRALTAVQIRDYNDNGYVSPIDIFSPSEAAANREEFDFLIASAQKTGHDGYSVHSCHIYRAAVHDMVTNAHILDCIEDLIGPDIVCWGTHFLSKMPDDGKRLSWHQDASYWPLTPSKTVTVWLAIDDADEENGAMQVIPRSHLNGQIPFERSTAEEQNILSQTVHNVQQFGDLPVSINLKSGQISLHSDLLLHGSKPNTSARRRCGLTIRYIPQDVRALNHWNLRSVICRGRDPSGHWSNVPRPEKDGVPPPQPKQ
jgi:non-heme Fe2+,alpha-ketoglutarate-dependent halogenase